MKEGWKEYKLGDIAPLVYGKALKAEERVEGKYKVYSSGGVCGYSNRLQAEKGIIVGRKGSVGTLYYSDTPFSVIDTAYYIPSVHPNCDMKFLFYLMSQMHLDQYNTDAAVPGLNRTVAEGLKLSLPTLATQHKIASILSRYDDLIEVNKRRIALLEASARELYKEWFVRFRFPRYEHEAFKEGKPANWEYEPVTDILDIKYGKDHKLLDEGRVPSYGSGGIMRKVDGFLYQGEAVLIPRKGTLNNIMYVNEKFWTIDTMFYGIPKIEHSAKITYYFLSSIDMEAFNSGAALPSMTTNILSGIKVLLPTSKLMADFDILTTPIFKAISNLKDANNTLSLQRDRLLPRLLSGDLSVD